MTKNNIWYCILSFAVIIAMVSCNSEDNGGIFSEDQQIEDFLTEMELLDSTLRDDSGVYYRILSENPSGAFPNATDAVGIYYTAKVADGEIFDSHENDGMNRPALLQFMTNSVLPVGLDNCISLLKEGEIGVFYIPPSLAYGEMADLSPLIPEGSVIQLIIELSSIQSEAQKFAQQTDSIEQFILQHELNDSIFASIDTVMVINQIWADIDTVMTPIDSLWITNINLTADSVMVPIDSIWYPVTGGSIAVDSIFLNNEYEWITNINLTADSVMVPLDSIWYPVTGGEIEVDSVFDYIDYVELLSSGIYYQTLTAGIEGTRVGVGEIASIGYQLYTLVSYPNSPINAIGSFDFIHQQSIVITGLDAGVFVMEHEERAILILPSNMAYGGSVFVIPRSSMDYFVEQEIIPSYSLTVNPFEVLVFDITLFAPQN